MVGAEELTGKARLQFSFIYTPLLTLSTAEYISLKDSYSMSGDMGVLWHVLPLIVLQKWNSLLQSDCCSLIVAVWLLQLFLPFSILCLTAKQARLGKGGKNWICHWNCDTRKLGPAYQLVTGFWVRPKGNNLMWVSSCSQSLRLQYFDRNRCWKCNH